MACTRRPAFGRRSQRTAGTGRHPNALGAAQIPTATHTVAAGRTRDWNRAVRTPLMSLIPSIEAANNGGFLWPSISDAVDTFLRRRHNGADSFERVWRPIHLWEAAEIALSLAAMSRLATDPSAAQMLRRQREFSTFGGERSPAGVCKGTPAGRPSYLSALAHSVAV